VADQPYLLISNEPVQMIEQMLTLPCIRMTDTRLAAQVHLVNHMSSLLYRFFQTALGLRTHNLVPRQATFARALRLPLKTSSI
jgi:hypothetical protein